MNLSLKKQGLFFSTACAYLLLLPFISFPLTTLIKPLPILCLLWMVMEESLPLWAKRVLMASLFFSLLGDIALTLTLQGSLETGILCFLIAHLGYIVLTISDFKFRVQTIILFLLVFSGIVYIFYHILFPALGPMMVPVMVYLCVLLFMVFSALQVRHNAWVIGAGALVFLTSDLLLALTLFVYKDLNSSLVIMFTYYLAQWLLTQGLIRNVYSRSAEKVSS